MKVVMNIKLPKTTPIYISSEDDVLPPGISPETLDAIYEAIEEIAAEEEALIKLVNDGIAVPTSEDNSS